MLILGPKTISLTTPVVLVPFRVEFEPGFNFAFVIDDGLTKPIPEFAAV